MRLFDSYSIHLSPFLSFQPIALDQELDPLAGAAIARASVKETETCVSV